MEKLYSSAEVAKMIGKSHVSVRRLARAHGIGMLVGKVYVFNEAEIERLRQINPLGGRPRLDGQPVEHKADTSKIKLRGPYKGGRKPGPEPTTEAA